MNIIYKGEAVAGRLREIRARSESENITTEKTVRNILDEVRKNGDAAVRELTKRFDKAELTDLRVSEEELELAVQSVDAELYADLEAAAENIRRFHACQKQNSWFTSGEGGVMTGQRVRGLARVGIYVPGGTAAYPSSVLMNAVPAKVAGVGEVIMFTPPSADGGVNKNILAAARIAGVDSIYKIGGAQAVAAAAYGTESVPKVDKIVGPGNIFVATAKSLVFGTVDIDMIAGPSEILIIAGNDANPRYIAADMLSQAEHDRLASSILLTDSVELAERVSDELEKQLEKLERKETAELSLRNFGAVLVYDSIDECIATANDIAPEHLEVLLPEPMTYLSRLDNAGSVFLGEYSPEPLGDYFAGPNHVLPTGGTARFFSPLSVDTFTKKSSFIYYSRDELLKAGKRIINIAENEGLTAHANSIRVRYEK